jgi:hypothetical protein
MASFALILSIVFFAAAAVFYSSASAVGHGNQFADNVCDAARTFCDHPEWLIVAGGIALFLALLARMIATVRR